MENYVFLSDDNLPLSVVVITYDVDDEFYGTLDSILSQTVLPKEVVVVAKHRAEINTDFIVKAEGLRVSIVVVDEDDKGIAHAFNLGLNYASADFVNFLNAGDRYLNEHSLELVRSNLNPNIPWFVYRRLDSNGGLLAPQKKFDTSASLYQFASGGLYLSHQAAFYSKSFIEIVGKYDERYMMLGMDFDLNLRAWGLAAPVLYDTPLVVYDKTGVSSVKFVETLYLKLIVVARSQLALRIRIPAIIKSSFRIMLGTCLRFAR